MAKQLYRVNWSVVDKVVLRTTDGDPYSVTRAKLNAAGIPCRKVNSEDIEVRLMDRDRAMDLVASYMPL